MESTALGYRDYITTKFGKTKRCGFLLCSKEDMRTIKRGSINMCGALIRSDNI